MVFAIAGRAGPPSAPPAGTARPPGSTPSPTSAVAGFFAYRISWTTCAAVWAWPRKSPKRKKIKRHLTMPKRMKIIDDRAKSDDKINDIVDQDILLKLAFGPMSKISSCKLSPIIIGDIRVSFDTSDENSVPSRDSNPPSP